MGGSPIPDGYYAVPSPTDPRQMTYWRSQTRKGVHRFGPWPSKARYGPDATVTQVNVAANPSNRSEMIQAFVAYYEAAQASIAADVAAAARRFAEVAVRCCCCGRTLTDDYSKVVGLGPECRKGTKAEALARLLTPEIGRAHAEHA